MLYFLANSFVHLVRALAINCPFAGRFGNRVVKLPILTQRALLAGLHKALFCSCVNLFRSSNAVSVMVKIIQANWIVNKFWGPSEQLLPSIVEFLSHCVEESESHCCS